MKKPSLKEILLVTDACLASLRWVGNMTPSQALKKIDRPGWLVWLYLGCGVRLLGHSPAYIFMYDAAPGYSNLYGSDDRLEPMLGHKLGREVCLAMMKKFGKPDIQALFIDFCNLTGNDPVKVISNLRKELKNA